jgi:hypothetical protein
MLAPRPDGTLFATAVGPPSLSTTRNVLNARTRTHGLIAQFNQGVWGTEVPHDEEEVREKKQKQ